MYIFVLQLENNKYFIGNTYNPYFSLSTYRHIDNDKNLFTLENKPLNICKFISKCNKFDEDKIVKKYMDKYGIDNVRGGSYNTLHLEQNIKYFIQKELWYINNKCTICGNSHLTEDCDKNIQNNTKKDIQNNTKKNITKSNRKSLNKCRLCFKFF